MKLYGYYRSSTSYRLRLALELKGLEYENCPVNLLESQQKGEAFTSRNPFATVPMLEADGKDRVHRVAGRGLPRQSPAAAGPPPAVSRTRTRLCHRDRAARAA